MEFSEVIQERRSVRWYLDKAVPLEMIHQILEEASAAPSFMNSQPWEVSVVTGESLAKIIQLYDTDKEYVVPIPWPPEWPDRQARLVANNREASGKRVLPESGRGRWNYNAPVIVYLHIHKNLNEWSIFDLGLFAQNVLLSATNHGLATVPQARLVMHDAKIRDILGLGTDRKLILGITLGYADWDHPNNHIKSQRDNPENWITVHN